MRAAITKLQLEIAQYREFISGVFAGVKEKLNELEETVGKIQEKNEKKSGHNEYNKRSVRAKSLMPDKFSGPEAMWKNWKADIEDYVETAGKQMMQHMKLAKLHKARVTEREFKAMGRNEFNKGKEVYKLCAKTDGEANEIITSSEEGNGWEAWRQLHAH